MSVVIQTFHKLLVDSVPDTFYCPDGHLLLSEAATALSPLPRRRGRGDKTRRPPEESKGVRVRQQKPEVCSE